MARRDDFLAFSSALTGFGMDVLSAADGAAGYLAIVDAKTPAGSLDALLRVYAGQIAAGKSPTDAVAAILAGTFDGGWPAWSLSAGIRSILKLWFVGLWIDDKSADGQPYPSAQAYARGLVWLAAQAHPVGVSNFRFGYWKDAPPPLSEFVGKTP
jgi:hypothetical protein